MARLESSFQSKLIKSLRVHFPGCVIQKLDTSYQQGIPDLLILFGTSWAVLECKRKRPTRPEDFEPNQEWWIEALNRMSFAACVYPENVEEVLHDLQLAFQPRRATRVSQR